MVLLSCLNNTARYQNYRYAAPSLALGCCVLAWGVDTLAKRRWPAAPLALVAALAPAGEFARQLRHYAMASRNIVEQHGVAAQRLRQWQPPVRRVLVGDAGAIPYLGELAALDGLGLGGYHRYPFARASRHGVAAVVELIERLPPHQRPDAMALYPGWWQGLADVFGTPVRSIHIDNNVICAADTKVLYRVDWGRLDTRLDWPANAWLSLDVGNLIDERKYHYRMSAPRGGRPCARTLRTGQKKLWDAGRIYPAGYNERFTVPAMPAAIMARDTQLIMRHDASPGAKELVVTVWRGDTPLRQLRTPLLWSPQQWAHTSLSLGRLRTADVIELVGNGGDWRSYHLWLAPAATR